MPYRVSGYKDHLEEAKSLLEDALMRALPEEARNRLRIYRARRGAYEISLGDSSIRLVGGVQTPAGISPVFQWSTDNSYLAVGRPAAEVTGQEKIQGIEYYDAVENVARAIASGWQQGISIRQSLTGDEEYSPTLTVSPTSTMAEMYSAALSPVLRTGRFGTTEALSVFYEQARTGSIPLEAERIAFASARRGAVNLRHGYLFRSSGSWKTHTLGTRAYADVFEMQLRKGEKPEITPVQLEQSGIILPWETAPRDVATRTSVFLTAVPGLPGGAYVRPDVILGRDRNRRWYGAPSILKTSIEAENVRQLLEQIGEADFRGYKSLRRRLLDPSRSYELARIGETTVSITGETGQIAPLQMVMQLPRFALASSGQFVTAEEALDEQGNLRPGYIDLSKRDNVLGQELAKLGGRLSAHGIRRQYVGGIDQPVLVTEYAKEVAVSFKDALKAGPVIAERIGLRLGEAQIPLGIVSSEAKSPEMLFWRSVAGNFASRGLPYLQKILELAQIERNPEDLIREVRGKPVIDLNRLTTEEFYTGFYNVIQRLRSMAESAQQPEQEIWHQYREYGMAFVPPNVADLSLPALQETQADLYREAMREAGVGAGRWESGPGGQRIAGAAGLLFSNVETAPIIEWFGRGSINFEGLSAISNLNNIVPNLGTEVLRSLGMNIRPGELMSFFADAFSNEKPGSAGWRAMLAGHVLTAMRIGGYAAEGEGITRVDAGQLAQAIAAAGGIASNMRVSKPFLEELSKQLGVKTPLMAVGDVYLPSPQAIMGIGEFTGSGEPVGRLARSYVELLNLAVSTEGQPTDTVMSLASQFYNRYVGSLSERRIRRMIGFETDKALSARYALSPHLEANEVFIPRSQRARFARAHGFKSVEEFDKYLAQQGDVYILGIREPNVSGRAWVARMVQESELIRRIQKKMIAEGGIDPKAAYRRAQMAVRAMQVPQVGWGLPLMGQGDLDFDPASFIMPLLKDPERNAQLQSMLQQASLLQHQSMQSLMGNMVPEGYANMFNELVKAMEEYPEMQQEFATGSIGTVAKRIAKGASNLPTTGEVIENELQRSSSKAGMGTSYNARRAIQAALLAQGVRPDIAARTFEATTPTYQINLDLARTVQPAIERLRMWSARQVDTLSGYQEAVTLGLQKAGAVPINSLLMKAAMESAKEPVAGLARGLNPLIRGAAAMLLSDTFPLEDEQVPMLQHEALPGMIAGHLDPERYGALREEFRRIATSDMSSKEKWDAGFAVINQFISSMTPEERLRMPLVTTMMGRFYADYLAGDREEFADFEQIILQSASEDSLVRDIMSTWTRAGAFYNMLVGKATPETLAAISRFVTENQTVAPDVMRGVAATLGAFEFSRAGTTDLGLRTAPGELSARALAHAYLNAGGFGKGYASTEAEIIGRILQARGLVESPYIAEARPSARMRMGRIFENPIIEQAVPGAAGTGQGKTLRFQVGNVQLAGKPDFIHLVKNDDGLTIQIGDVKVSRGGQSRETDLLERAQVGAYVTMFEQGLASNSDFARQVWEIIGKPEDISPADIAKARVEGTLIRVPSDQLEKVLRQRYNMMDAPLNVILDKLEEEATQNPDVYREILGDITAERIGVTGIHPDDIIASVRWIQENYGILPDATLANTLLAAESIGSIRIKKDVAAKIAGIAAGISQERTKMLLNRSFGFNLTSRLKQEIDAAKVEAATGGQQPPGEPPSGGGAATADAEPDDEYFRKMAEAIMQRIEGGGQKMSFTGTDYGTVVAKMTDAVIKWRRAASMMPNIQSFLSNTPDVAEALGISPEEIENLTPQDFVGRVARYFASDAPEAEKTEMLGRLSGFGDFFRTLGSISTESMRMLSRFGNMEGYPLLQQIATDAMLAGGMPTVMANSIYSAIREYTARSAKARRILSKVSDLMRPGEISPSGGIVWQQYQQAETEAAALLKEIGVEVPEGASALSTFTSTIDILPIQTEEQKARARRILSTVKKLPRDLPDVEDVREALGETSAIQTIQAIERLPTPEAAEAASERFMPKEFEDAVRKFSKSLEYLSERTERLRATMRELDETINPITRMRLQRRMEREKRDVRVADIRYQAARAQVEAARARAEYEATGDPEALERALRAEARQVQLSSRELLAEAQGDFGYRAGRLFRGMIGGWGLFYMRHLLNLPIQAMRGEYTVWERSYQQFAQIAPSLGIEAFGGYQALGDAYAMRYASPYGPVSLAVRRMSNAGGPVTTMLTGGIAGAGLAAYIAGIAGVTLGGPALGLAAAAGGLTAGAAWMWGARQDQSVAFQVAQNARRSTGLARAWYELEHLLAGGTVSQMLDQQQIVSQASRMAFSGMLSDRDIQRIVMNMPGEFPERWAGMSRAGRVAAQRWLAYYLANAPQIGDVYFDVTSAAIESGRGFAALGIQEPDILAQTAFEALSPSQTYEQMGAIARFGIQIAERGLAGRGRLAIQRAQRLPAWMREQGLNWLPRFAQMSDDEYQRYMQMLAIQEQRRMLGLSYEAVSPFEQIMTPEQITAAQAQLGRLQGIGQRLMRYGIRAAPVLQTLEAFPERMALAEASLSGNPLALTALAAQGEIPNEYATMDVSMQGVVTGLPLFTTSLRWGSMAPEQVAAMVWGSDWQTTGDVALRNAMVSGIQAPWGATLYGMRAARLMQIQRSYQQAMASSGLAYQRAQLQYAFTTGIGLDAYGVGQPFAWNIPGVGSGSGGPGIWGYQDAMMQMQTAMRRWQFDQRRLRMDFAEDYWRAGFAMNMQQFNIGMAYMRQQWGFQDTARNLRFGWQMQDMRESLMFATGRQRRMLERQMQRAVVMRTLEDEQIQAQRDYQEKIWNIQKERYDKEKEHHERMRRLQEQDFEKQKLFFEERTRLEEQYRRLQRRYYEEQHKLQLRSIGLQSQFAALNYKAQQDLLAIEQKREDIQGKFKTMMTLTEEWVTLVSDAILGWNKALGGGKTPSGGGGGGGKRGTGAMSSMSALAPFDMRAEASPTATQPPIASIQVTIGTEDLRRIVHNIVVEEINPPLHM